MIKYRNMLFTHNFIPRLTAYTGERVTWPMKTVLRAKITALERYVGNGFRRPVLLTYPEKPKTYHALYKIAHHLGYHIVNTSSRRPDCVIHFEDTTYRRLPPLLATLGEKHTIINHRCTDISKRTVDRVFTDTFGYSMSIDPRTHEGPYVRKSDLNALHDGRVQTGRSEPEEGFVYQRLINNEDGAGRVVDLRVPVFRRSIPLVMLRTRSVHDRFDETTGCTLVPTSEVLDREEIERIHTFCERIGLEYGELDILRDRDTSLLYIVDVNNTPAGPIGALYADRPALRRWFEVMSSSFEEQFGTNDQSWALRV